MFDTVPQRRWAGAAVVVGGAGALIGVAVRYGLPTGLLLIAGGLLLLVIWLLWTSVLGLSGETSLTLEEALHLAAPRAEEEQKRSVLRALKDLEYERRVGKVGEDDYAQLSARYREDAKALLLEVDRSYYQARQAAEQRIADRLRRRSSDAVAGHKKRKSPRNEKRRGKPQQAGGAKPDAPGPSRRCERCGHRNALPLTVCAGCSQPLAPVGSALCPACPAVYDATLLECPTCGVRRGGV
jgi:hypothetical protein